MAEEDLKKTILDKIQEEKDIILKDAKDEARKILASATLEAEVLKEAHLKEIKKNCLFKKNTELSRIILAGKREILSAKDKKIQEALSSITIKSDKTVLKRLLQESLECFDKDTKLKIKVNPSDKDLISEFIERDVEIETSESIDGGFILSDIDEKITVVNTISTQMEKIKQKLKEKLGKALFQEGQPNNSITQ